MVKSRIGASFLEIFPRFIEQVDALLLPEARLEPRSPRSLTPELRILAAIRLGITDTATIAALLHCSIRTVYNYRSFVQRHVRPEVGDLEQRVQLIGINGNSDHSTQNPAI